MADKSWLKISKLNLVSSKYWQPETKPKPEKWPKTYLKVGRMSCKIWIIWWNVFWNEFNWIWSKFKLDEKLDRSAKSHFKYSHLIFRRFTVLRLNFIDCDTCVWLNATLDGVISYSECRTFVCMSHSLWFACRLK